MIGVAEAFWAGVDEAFEKTAIPTVGSARFSPMARALPMQETRGWQALQKLKKARQGSPPGPPGGVEGPPMKQVTASSLWEMTKKAISPGLVGKVRAIRHAQSQGLSQLLTQAPGGSEGAIGSFREARNIRQIPSAYFGPAGGFPFKPRHREALAGLRQARQGFQQQRGEYIKRRYGVEGPPMKQASIDALREMAKEAVVPPEFLATLVQRGQQARRAGLRTPGLPEGLPAGKPRRGFFAPESPSTLQGQVGRARQFGAEMPTAQFRDPMRMRQTLKAMDPNLYASEMARYRAGRLARRMEE